MFYYVVVVSVMEIKTYSCTGHRPHKLNQEYDYDGPCTKYVYKEILRILAEDSPDVCISGMAIGADTLFALAALELEIPLIAALPFIGQENRWPEKSKKIYREILNNPLTTKKVVSEGGYSAHKMHLRDMYMVDEADKVLAVFNGTKGGTYYTVKYAIKNDVDIIYVDPDAWKEKDEEQLSLFD